MAMNCDRCKKECYCIHVTPDHEKLCDCCYDKVRHKWEKHYEKTKGEVRIDKA
jgi:hypothetical protein